MYLSRNKPRSEQTATPKKYPQGYFRVKGCRECAADFAPSAPSALYCSDLCAGRGLQSRYLERNYGISLNDYLQRLNAQRRRCRLCGGEGFTMAEHHQLKLVVDHCHSTGRVRGLLCHNCNRALGLLRDDPATLRRAISYLSKDERRRQRAEPDLFNRMTRAGMYDSDAPETAQLDLFSGAVARDEG